MKYYPHPGSPRQARLQTGSLLVLALIATTVALREGADIAVPIALAALASLILSPVARVLERTGMPSSAAAALLVAGAAGVVIALIYAFVPASTELRERAPQIARDIEWLLMDISRDVEATTGVDTDLPPDSEILAESGQRLISELLLSTPSLLAGLLLGTFLTFFLLSERDRVWRSAIWCCTGLSARLRLGRTLRDTQKEVGTYLFTITCINTCLGVAAGLMFSFLGIPNPWIWGAAMALMNFMPYLGPALMNVMILTTGLLTFPTWQEALIPSFCLAMLNLLEGNIITPRLVGQQAQISALAVFLAVAVGAWVWGAAGALIATPTLILIRSFVARMT